MNEKIREQILAVRNTGLTNMLDTNAVQYYANERNYFDLVIFIEDHKDQYVNFILHGD